MLSTARKLARSATRPRQTDLKRAVSTAYYAMFNFLAADCADLFIGTGQARKYPSWSRVHRALDHGLAKNACQQTAKLGLPPAIVQFSDLFVSMQQQRHDADYDPLSRYARADVIALINDVEQAIKAYKTTSRKDRREFAAHVLLRQRG